MRALMLDFQPRRRASAFGWSLLLVGLLVGAVGLWTHLQLDAQEQQAHGRLRQAEGQLHGDSESTVGLSPAESREQAARMAEMRRISAQLRRPWERLFAMLEALPRDQVALLSLTPDARKGQVRITAEAKDLEAMLEFHRQLESSAELSDVSLLNHEVDAKSAEHPVQFNLQASWEVGDAHP
ncbi:PilN domain-containing protein [Pseudomonas akapageensis]|uniref:PilN domain-containing protein n=1 Tax=Pseudomonas akapageensis TaxID=2609961 RepID=UPI00140B4FE7|nr:PilN domain-containing protein [Pseudomonas akapageensis]